MLLETATPPLLEVLRGDRGRRPTRDTTAAAGLRSQLTDLVFECRGERPSEPLVITGADVRRASSAHEIADSPLARARGILVTTALRLTVAQVHLDDPYHDALLAWRAERPRHALIDLDALDVDQVARLRAEVNAHVTTLTSQIPSVPAAWRPRSAQRANVILAGGALIVRDVIDLAVGSTSSERASVALLDVTTSPLSPASERLLRYHALVETLRSSVVPLRTSIFSTATAQVWSLDVDATVLQRGLEDLAAILQGMSR